MRNEIKTRSLYPNIAPESTLLVLTYPPPQNLLYSCKVGPYQLYFHFFWWGGGKVVTSNNPSFLVNNKKISPRKKHAGNRNLGIMNRMGWDARMSQVVTWRITPVSKWLGSPPFISHEKAICKGSHNPS